MLVTRLHYWKEWAIRARQVCPPSKDAVIRFHLVSVPEALYLLCFQKKETIISLTHCLQWQCSPLNKVHQFQRPLLFISPMASCVRRPQWPDSFWFSSASLYKHAKQMSLYIFYIKSWCQIVLWRVNELTDGNSLPLFLTTAQMVNELT